jgi:cell division protein FtsB
MNEDTHESIRASLAANVLRLGNECRDLAAENARLKAEVERLTDAITRGAITPDAKEEQS